MITPPTRITIGDVSASSTQVVVQGGSVTEGHVDITIGKSHGTMTSTTETTSTRIEEEKRSSSSSAVTAGIVVSGEIVSSDIPKPSLPSVAISRPSFTGFGSSTSSEGVSESISHGHRVDVETHDSAHTSTTSNSEQRTTIAVEEDKKQSSFETGVVTGVVGGLIAGQVVSHLPSPSTPSLPSAPSVRPSLHTYGSSTTSETSSVVVDSATHSHGTVIQSSSSENIASSTSTIKQPQFVISSGTKSSIDSHSTSSTTTEGRANSIESDSRQVSYRTLNVTLGLTPLSLLRQL